MTTRFEEMRDENEELRQMLGRVVDEADEIDWNFVKPWMCLEMVNLFIEINKFMEERWLTR